MAARRPDDHGVNRGVDEFEKALSCTTCNKLVVSDDTLLTHAACGCIQCQSCWSCRTCPRCKEESIADTNLWGLDVILEQNGQRMETNEQQPTTTTAHQVLTALKQVQTVLSEEKLVARNQFGGLAYYGGDISGRRGSTGRMGRRRQERKRNKSAAQPERDFSVFDFDSEPEAQNKADHARPFSSEQKRPSTNRLEPREDKPPAAARQRQEETTNPSVLEMESSSHQRLPQSFTSVTPAAGKSKISRRQECNESPQATGNDDRTTTKKAPKTKRFVTPASILGKRKLLPASQQHSLDHSHSLSDPRNENQDQTRSGLEGVSEHVNDRPVPFGMHSIDPLGMGSEATRENGIANLAHPKRDDMDSGSQGCSRQGSKSSSDSALTTLLSNASDSEAPLLRSSSDSALNVTRKGEVESRPSAVETGLDHVEKSKVGRNSSAVSSQKLPRTCDLQALGTRRASSNQASQSQSGVGLPSSVINKHQEPSAGDGDSAASSYVDSLLISSQTLPNTSDFQCLLSNVPESDSATSGGKTPVRGESVYESQTSVASGSASQFLPNTGDFQSILQVAPRPSGDSGEGSEMGDAQQGEVTRQTCKQGAEFSEAQGHKAMSAPSVAVEGRSATIRDEGVGDSQSSTESDATSLQFQLPSNTSDSKGLPQTEPLTRSDSEGAVLEDEQPFSDEGGTTGTDIGSGNASISSQMLAETSDSQTARLLPQKVAHLPARISGSAKGTEVDVEQVETTRQMPPPTRTPEQAEGPKSTPVLPDEQKGPVLLPSDEDGEQTCTQDSSMSSQQLPNTPAFQSLLRIQSPATYESTATNTEAMQENEHSHHYAGESTVAKDECVLEPPASPASDISSVSSQRLPNTGNFESVLLQTAPQSFAASNISVTAEQERRQTTQSQVLRQKENKQMMMLPPDEDWRCQEQACTQRSIMASQLQPNTCERYEQLEVLAPDDASIPAPDKQAAQLSRMTSKNPSMHSAERCESVSSPFAKSVSKCDESTESSQASRGPTVASTSSCQILPNTVEFRTDLHRTVPQPSVTINVSPKKLSIAEQERRQKMPPPWTPEPEGASSQLLPNTDDFNSLLPPAATRNNLHIERFDEKTLSDASIAAPSPTHLGAKTSSVYSTTSRESAGSPFAKVPSEYECVADSQATTESGIESISSQMMPNSGDFQTVLRQPFLQPPDRSNVSVTKSDMEQEEKRQTTPQRPTLGTSPAEGSKSCTPSRTLPNTCNPESLLHPDTSNRSSVDMTSPSDTNISLALDRDLGESVYDCAERICAAGRCRVTTLSAETKHYVPLTQWRCNPFDTNSNLVSAVCRPTLDYFTSLVFGISLVDSRWISDCEDHGKWMKEDDYRVWGDSFIHEKVIELQKGSCRYSWLKETGWWHGQCGPCQLPQAFAMPRLDGFSIFVWEQQNHLPFDHCDADPNDTAADFSEDKENGLAMQPTNYVHMTKRNIETFCRQLGAILVDNVHQLVLSDPALTRLAIFPASLPPAKFLSHVKHLTLFGSSKVQMELQSCPTSALNQFQVIAVSSCWLTESIAARSVAPIRDYAYGVLTLL